MAAQEPGPEKWRHVERFPIIRQIASRWLKHDNARSAAAIAYYAIFTLAPTLVVATVVASRFFGSENARKMIVQRARETFGAAGAEVAESILASEGFFRTSLVTPVVSGLLLLYGASLMFFHLRSALNRILECQPNTSRDAFISALIGRLLAALFVIGTGGLLIATLVTNVVLTRMTEWLTDNTALQIQTWHFLEGVISVVAVALVFVAVLKFLPTDRPPIRCVLPGAAVAIVLFEAAKWLIGLYISRSVVASAYGPSSSIVALVLWIYLSTQILLFGAEICRVSMDRREAVD
jgi:membrane protein